MLSCVLCQISYLGVLAIVASILVLAFLPLLDTSRIRGGQFRPLYKAAFWALVADFVVLSWIGINHAEQPYINIGIGASVFYFAWFLVIVPLIGLVENVLADIGTETALLSSR